MSGNLKATITRSALFSGGILLVGLSLLVPERNGYTLLNEASLASIRGADSETLFQNTYSCSDAAGQDGAVGFSSCLEEFVQCAWCDVRMIGIQADEFGEPLEPMTYEGQIQCAGERMLGWCTYNAATDRYECDTTNSVPDGTWCDHTVPDYSSQPTGGDPGTP